MAIFDCDLVLPISDCAICEFIVIVRSTNRGIGVCCSCKQVNENVTLLLLICLPLVFFLAS